MVKVFISGYPLDMQELELVQLVSPFGEVSTIKIVRDKKTGKAKGYSFLEMKDEEAAANVIAELDCSFLGDRQLSVRTATEKAAGPVRSGSKPYQGGGSRPAPRYGNSNNNNSSSGSAEDQFKKKRPRRTI
jgi:RNA recognition motif-containing protein